MNFFKKFFILLLVLLFVFGCSKTKDEVVVKAGSSKVTKEELQDDIKNLPPQVKTFLLSPDGINRLKDELVKRQLLYEEARKKGIEKSNDFKRKLEEFKKITLINLLLEQEIKSLKPVTENEAKEYYGKHKDEFIKPTEVRLSQIVVKNEDEAKNVYERINKGEDFGKIAKEVSNDQKTKLSGGDIGFFKKGQLNQQIENVVFNLKKGQISMPLTTPNGISIFKVTDIKGTPIDFESIKLQLIEQLKAKKQQDWFNSYIEDLKKKHSVEVNEKALQEVINKSLVENKLGETLK